MKRCGFSLTEIIMFIFTIVVIAAVLFPLKIIDLNQAERIAKWKTFYPELNYSFSIMQYEEKPFISAYEKDKTLNPDTFFAVFLNYLNVDKQKTTQFDFSRHRHHFLNGKIINRFSKYKADKFVILENGMIISFSGMDRTVPETKNSPIGLIFVDVNGKSRRNIIGRDVFTVEMYADRLEPMGYNSSRQEMKEDCSPVGSGLKCSAYYLVGGSF